MKHALTALVIVGLLAGAAAPARAFHEGAGRAIGDAVGEMVDEFRGFANQLGQHLRGTPGMPGAPTSPAERPVISFMLDHRDELALTPDQVSRLESLRRDFARAAVRRDADIRIAEMDLAALLDAEPLDMAKIEPKIRELETLRADMRIERLRTLERGRALLSPEQRTKLHALLGGPARPPRRPTAL